MGTDCAAWRAVTGTVAGVCVMCCRPFSVTPSSGTLEVFESTQVTVTFKPMTVGDHSRDLVLHYHTGERKPPKLGPSAGDIPKMRSARAYPETLVRVKQ